jgi:hypothetical protein
MGERGTPASRLAVTALVVAAGLAALAVVSLSLAVFGAAGLFLGGLVRRVARAISSRRRSRTRAIHAPASLQRWGGVLGGALLVAGVASALLALLSTDGLRNAGPRVREVVTARYVADARYRDDVLVLDERLAVTPERIAAIAARLAPTEPPAPVEDPEQLVASRLEAAGLEIVEVVDGALVARFPSRSLPVEASRWSLRTTLDFEVPSVDLGPVVVEADEDSFVTLVGPRRLVTETSPPADRIDSLPNGEERLRVGLGSAFATAGSVTVELRGPLARTPIVGDLLETSPWDAVYWLVGILIGYYRHRLAQLVRAVLDGLLRRARRPRSAPSRA